MHHTHLQCTTCGEDYAVAWESSDRLYFAELLEEACDCPKPEQEALIDAVLDQQHWEWMVRQPIGRLL